MIRILLPSSARSPTVALFRSATKFGAETLEHLPPEKLVEDILAKERRIMEIMEEIKAELEARQK